MHRSIWNENDQIGLQLSKAFFQSACSELNELPALKNGAQCTAGCETWIVLASFVLFPESNLK